MKFKSVFRKAIFAVVGISIAACSAEDSEESSSGNSNAASERTTTHVQFENSTSETIVDIFMTLSDSNYWGADQLREGILTTGEKFKLIEIPCGISYDAKAVAQSGDEYLLMDTLVSCEAIYRWIITNSTSRTGRKTIELEIIDEDEFSREVENDSPNNFEFTYKI